MAKIDMQTWSNIRFAKKVLICLLLADLCYIITRFAIATKTGITDFASLDDLVTKLSGVEGGALGLIKIAEIWKGDNNA